MLVIIMVLSISSAIPPIKISVVIGMVYPEKSKRKNIRTQHIKIKPAKYNRLITRYTSEEQILLGDTFERKI
jgi:hypothetical protein